VIAPRGRWAKSIPGASSRVSDISRLIALCLIASFSLAIVLGWAVGGGWKLIDMDVYWTAGKQWRISGNPYTLAAGATEHTVFRYSPWFAGLWVPLTYLPRPVVDVAWSVLMLGAAFAAVLPILARFGWRQRAIRHPYGRPARRHGGVGKCPTAARGMAGLGG